MPYWNPDPIQKFLEFIKKKASLLIFPEPNFYFKEGGGGGGEPR